MSRDQRCRLCGTRASAFGCYETCRWDGPPHEWEDIPDDADLWTRFAHACMECGAERQDPPEKLEPWWCVRCVQDWERSSCGCPDCKAKDAEVGNRFNDGDD